MVRTTCSWLKVRGNFIVVVFNHCAKGLRTNDGKRVLWFEVAGKDGIFRPAIADIEGKDKVKICHPMINHPVKVPFGWMRLLFQIWRIRKDCLLFLLREYVKNNTYAVLLYVLFT